jgi:predicted dithiol-disulfide oxidoreductase (DUF899 family)
MSALFLLGGQFQWNYCALEPQGCDMIAVSRAPYSKLAAYRKRMGWDFKWFSSYDTDINFDYHVSFTHEELAKKEALYNYTVYRPLPSAEREGVSVFFKDSRGRVFHTNSAYARGIDMLNVVYHYLDLVPKGRDEAAHDFPQFRVRRHDEYGKTFHGCLEPKNYF